MSKSNLLSPGVHQFAVPGVTLSYTVQGDGPLLFIQAAGWGIGSRYLRIGLKALEESFTLVFLEPRGNGLSGRPENEKEMGTGEMADDIERLRIYLGLEQIDVIGHSNGGTIVLDFLERYPSSARKAILLTHWLSGYDDSATFKRFKEARRGNPIYAEAMAAMETPEPKTQKEWFERLKKTLGFYVADPPAHYAAFRDAMGEPSLWTSNAQHAADKANTNLDLYSNLHLVKAHTLALGADEDPVCSANASKVTSEGIQGGELCIIKGSGHFPWIEKPKDFKKAVIEFFLGI